MRCVEWGGGGAIIGGAVYCRVLLAHVQQAVVVVRVPCGCVVALAARHRHGSGRRKAGACHHELDDGRREALVPAVLHNCSR